MKHSGLDVPFIAGCSQLAQRDAGVFDLMELWFEETDEAERDELLAVLQDTLDEAASLPHEPERRPYIPFADMDNVTTAVMAHKQRLRDLIDRHGGVTAVARKVGMPQPSLSRLLSSAAMPRKTTLYKIADALGVPETEIVGEWVR